jgi:Glycosyl transferases group 1
MTPRGLAVRLVIRLKLATQAVGLRRRGDVYVDCTGDWRYPAFLLAALRRCGDFVLEFPERDAVMAWGADGFRNFLLRSRIVSGSGAPTAPVIVAREASAIPGEPRSRVRVSVDWFSPDLQQRDLVMPYFVHPALNRYRAELEELALRAERRIRIGFAGTVGDLYREKLAFPVLGRMEVLETIAERFAEQAVVAATPPDPAGEDKPIVLVLSPGERHVPTRHPLVGRAYVRFLGSCAFFLAAPGFRMPLAHNVIEAIAAGAVPILNYAEWLRPPPRDGIECLRFSTLEELVDVVERALTMDSAEIAILRDGVRHYYAEHLSVDSFARRLRPVLAQSPTIVVNAERETVALWRERRRA